MLINGINEYQKAPPNKILNVNAKINVINENEIAAVYDLNMVEIDNAKTDMTNTISNKVNDIEKRFNALTSKQQQDGEVIDARGDYESLRLRLEAIEKTPLILFEEIEG